MVTKRKSKVTEPVSEQLTPVETTEVSNPESVEVSAPVADEPIPAEPVEETGAEEVLEAADEQDADEEEYDDEEDFDDEDEDEDGEEEASDEDEEELDEDDELDEEDDEDEDESDDEESEESAEDGDDENEPIVWDNGGGELVRLQKILAQAGVASRRRAEELIEEGKVQVNGQVVTTLGAKADPTRDHIRVDGKLLHGPERLRYFLLNKPKGYVTTVTDPEKRPTVMEFFQKLKERLYPVGRLDYLSEGLLLVTNDGELANKLTRAASGVEKTYLVKIAGQPSDEELDQLREGISIQRNRTGEDRVQTAPARIRQVRRGDNPWFEVILTEGRNRELRKMFEEIGHFVEKIRRIGYGPLVLDVEPGTMRELTQDEVSELRDVAAGRKREISGREKRVRRQIENETLPTVRPLPTRSFEGGDRRPGGFGDRKPGGFAPRGNFGGDRPNNFRPKPYGDRPRPSFQAGEGQDRPSFRPQGDRPSFRPAGDRPAFRPQGDRPQGDRRPGGFGDRKPGGFAPRGNFGGDRPNNFRPKPYGDRPQGGNFDRPRPTFEGGEGQDRPSFRPAGDRPSFRPQGDRPSFRPQGDRRPGGFGDRKPGGFAPRGNFGGDRPNNFRPKPYGDRPQGGNFDRPRPTFEGGEGQERPSFSPQGDRLAFRPQGDRPQGDRRPGGFGDRKPGGFAPRGNFGGPRPNNFRPRPDGDRPQGGFGDRPRPSFQGGEGQERPSFRPQGDRPAFRPAGDRPSFRPQGDRPQGDRRPGGFGDRKPGGFAPRGNFGGPRPNNFRPRPDGDRPQGNFSRPAGEDRGGDRPRTNFGPRPEGSGPRPGGFGGGKPGGFKPKFGSKPGGFGGKKPGGFGPKKPGGFGPKKFGGKPGGFKKRG